MNSAVVPGLIEAAFPGCRHRAKRVARLVPDLCLETVRRCLRREREWSAEHLLRMARESQEMRAEMLRLLGDWNDAENPHSVGVGSGPARVVAGAARAVARLTDRVRP